MMSSPPPNYCYQTSSRWFTDRRSQARLHTLNSQPTALANTLRSPKHPHLQQLAHTDSIARSSLRVSLSQIPTLAHVPKSP
jgi:hypothetical protein